MPLPRELVEHLQCHTPVWHPAQEQLSVEMGVGKGF